MRRWATDGEASAGALGVGVAVLAAGARVKTAELLGRLQRHYIKPGEPFPGGVFVPECGINGGTGAGSRCDALYVGFTSTSGRLLVGHELKVSRADWQHELDQPGKADAWADQCHAWYVVAPDLEVVPPETLPAGWGLMVPKPRSKVRMHAVVPAAVHRDRQPSWTVVRSVMARLDTLRVGAIHEARHQAQQEAQAKVAEQVQLRLDVAGQRELTTEQQARLNALDDLEARLGQTIAAGWGEQFVRPAQFAAALRLVSAAARLQPSQYLVRDVERLLEQVQALAAAQAEWEAVADGSIGA